MKPQKNIFKVLLVWLVLGVFFAYLFYFFYQNPERIQQLFSLSLEQILVLTGLSLLTFLGLGLQLSFSVLPFIKNLSWSESLQLSISNNLLNYFPLKSGMIAKGVYLNTLYGLSAQKYLLALLGGQLVWVLCSALIGITAGLYLLLTSDSLAAGILLVLGVMGLSGVFAYLLLFYSQYLKFVIPLKKLAGLLQAYTDELRAWRKYKGVLSSFTWVSLLLFVCFSLRIWVVFQILGQSFSVPAAFFLQACIAISFAFSVVPGNLGLKEGLLAGLAILLGADAEIAVLAAVLDRAASLLPVLILGPVFLHRLGSRALSPGAK